MSEPEFSSRVRDYLEEGNSDPEARLVSLGNTRFVGKPARLPRNFWLSLVLLGATLVTTTVFGFALVQSFSLRHTFDLDLIVDGYLGLVHGEARIWTGLLFSIPLLLILLAHELGHYIECRIWRVNASLPYFMPSPTLFGTLGAFIRIRSPIYSRRGLFDIGISGPLAGFAMLLPFLIAGVCLSVVAPSASTGAPFVFGTPLLIRLVEHFRFPGVPASHILLHPLGMAAWGGLLATAINLLPMGQLDGGHIVYAVFGARWHRRISTAFIVILALLGFVYWAWWIWAGLMLFFGRRHPLVYDRSPLSQNRVFLAGVALAILVLSISIVPVRTL